jgi:Secretion system C-terminal sorting domain
MKHINLLIFFLSLLYVSSLSAVPTFGKKIEGVRYSLSASPTKDGGMIISGISFNSDSTIIIKTDRYGQELWRKYFEGYGSLSGLGYYFSTDINQTEDGGYIFINIIKKQDAQISIFKLDRTGEIVWTKIYDNEGDDVSREVLVTHDGGFMFLYRNKAISYMVKTDSIGNEQWVVTDTLSGFTNYDLQIRQTKDKGYIFGRRTVLIKYDQFGNKIWKMWNSRYIRDKVEELSRGGFILVSKRNHTVERTDSLGSTIWRTRIDETLGDFTIDSYDNIIAVGKKITKLDTSGNIIWQKDIPFLEVSDIYTEDDGNIILTGRLDNFSGFVARYDSVGEATFLILTRPQSGERLEGATRYNIEWVAPGLGEILIEWQNEEHMGWNLIAQVPDSLKIYNWITPARHSIKNKVRISSVADQNIFSQNKTYFSIGAKSYDYIAINEIFMYFATDGMGSYDRFNLEAGFFWPGGQDATQVAVFEDGPLWGGLVNGDTLVHGSTYRQGLQPGNIIEEGVAVDPDSPDFGIYKVRPDWILLPDSPLKERLEYDWNHWPVHLGAPWIDEDGDGNYNPQIDRPDIRGDEMNWMVMNDLDSVKTKNLYGADPIGIEVQLAISGYNTDNDLKDVVFKRYKHINKSDNTVDSMYFAYWADVDLGDAGDDYVGTDMSLNMLYSFNGDNDDPIYPGVPPAIGYVLLQGPLISSVPSDSAFAFNRWHLGYENLKMTSTMMFINGDPLYADPSLGTNGGSRAFWNIMRGKAGNGGSKINPLTEKAALFVAPGSPVEATGWYEGAGWPNGPRSGDRRMVMSSGPVTFAPGDSQEVVYAIILARGEDRLDSITKLKEKAVAIREFYYTGQLPTAIKETDPSVLPFKFSLSQNYPNPFNPSTIINYELRIMNEVKLVVYDVLGREVKTLVDKTQQAGKYKVTFNATGFASGVYYYKLKAGKSFEKTRKMLLLR